MKTLCIKYTKSRQKLINEIVTKIKLIVSADDVWNSGFLTKVIKKKCAKNKDTRLQFHEAKVFSFIRFDMSNYKDELIQLAVDNNTFHGFLD